MAAPLPLPSLALACRVLAGCDQGPVVYLDDSFLEQCFARSVRYELRAPSDSITDITALDGKRRLWGPVRLRETDCTSDNRFKQCAVPSRFPDWAGAPSVVRASGPEISQEVGQVGRV